MTSFIDRITSQVQETMKQMEEQQYATDSYQTNIAKNASYDTAASKSNTSMYHYASKVFRLPIEYVPEIDKHSLSSTVISDLEFVNTLDDSIPSMYDSTFMPNTEFAKQIVPMFQHTYTTNIGFLTDTQTVIDNMRAFQDHEQICPRVACDTTEFDWSMVKHDPKFMETYGYLEWEMLKPYNKNSIVLQTLTISNMLAPVMSFFIPILFLLFPFVILKIQGIPITLSIYFRTLKDVARNHFIGQALAVFESFSIQKFIYLLVMLGLYGFQMYQNTVQCLRFYKSIQRINTELCNWKQFRNRASIQIERFLIQNDSLESYKPFCSVLQKHSIVLQDLYSMLEPIKSFSCSIAKTTEIGYMLKCYYELHTNPQYEETILYSMGFDGYLSCMNGLYSQLQKGTIAKTVFVNDNTEDTKSEADADSDSDSDSDVDSETEVEEKRPSLYMKNQYYPPHKDSIDCVKNDVVLDMYGVITGPNASGKTTFLKTTAINVILSQQCGIGFYSECKMKPYTHIHSYLNIPDTSGRDSLFQAESRRCKTILETIQKDTNGMHFCIFDELYSGTNPREATQAAYGFLQYLRQYSHVDLFLTTHYVSICDQWETEEEPDPKHIRPIQNYKMAVNTIESGKHTPTYKIESGISRVEGAIEILENMEYPQELLELISNSSSKKTPVIEDIDV